MTFARVSSLRTLVSRLKSQALDHFLPLRVVPVAGGGLQQGAVWRVEVTNCFSSLELAMKSMWIVVAASLLGSFCLGAPAIAADDVDEGGEEIQEPIRLPGAQPAGDILLPNQWSLRPAASRSSWATFR